MSGDIQLAAQQLEGLAQRDVSLAPLCTYKVGGSAALFVEVNAVAELERVLDAVQISGCDTLLIGRGSNLLVSDNGFDGIAVQLGSAFGEIDIDLDTALVRVGAQALLPVVARRTATAGLTGFEWAVGVPGSIGGAVRMNAGGHGSDMAASLVRVSVFDFSDGGPVEWLSDQLEFAYRSSALTPEQIVLYAELELAHGDADAAQATISEIVQWRRSNQPGGQNAGSVFTNPGDESAGRLIDELGLKGFRVGTAEVSQKHANFIQADPDGSADDVFRLILEVQRRVESSTGIELHPENRLIGFEHLTETKPGNREMGR